MLLIWLLRQVNMRTVSYPGRKFTQSFWFAKRQDDDKARYHGYSEVKDTGPFC